MKKQPALELPKSLFAKFLDSMTLLIFLAVIICLVIQFPSLPDRVPGHYNASGTVDRWRRKIELLALPIVAAGL